MENTARGNRIHIGLYGKVNVGKSTFLNKIAGQNVSIISEFEGTTTDVVYKPMELHKVGAVVFMDTAGFDDKTELGIERKKKTFQTLDKTDLILFLTDYNELSENEIEFLKENKNNKILTVITKNDIKKIDENKIEKIKKYCENVFITNYSNKDFVEKFEDEILKLLPNKEDEKTILDGIVSSKDIVVLVIPVDKEAPKGRLILPQVQVIRELLDINAKTIIVKEDELSEIIEELKTKPKLVITDSQAFNKVSKIVDEKIPLTSFSILFANYKGDIKTFVEGAKKLDNLKENAKILFLESCTHHAIDDDIARVKIPKLLEKKTGKKFSYNYFSGCSMPDDLKEYDFIIHCGACMTNRKEVLSRIDKVKNLNLPITNYGIIIAYCLGILDRATKPVIK